MLKTQTWRVNAVLTFESVVIAEMLKTDKNEVGFPQGFESVVIAEMLKIAMFW